MYAWSAAMSVGVRELDAQHQRIFVLLNAIIDAAANNAPEGKTALHELLDEFMRYFVFHNENEERHMTEYQCGDAAHFESHALFHEKVAAMYAVASPALKSGASDAHARCEELAHFAGDWYTLHIATMDKHYTRCFNDHGFS